MDFSFWLLAGATLGMILMGFLTVGSYQRGYNAGYTLRKPWQAELQARHLAVRAAHQRGLALPRTPWMPDTAPVETQAA